MSHIIENDRSFCIDVGEEHVPKQTFFNLPAHKREHLVEAIKQEFSRAPLYKASISNIVKLADIPRGSFYQYFEDKEDAFYYLLNEQSKAIHQHFFSLLEKNNGDLYTAFIHLFQFTLEEIENKNNIHYLKNAFINLNHEVEDILTKVFSDHSNQDGYQLLYELTDKEKINLEHEEDFRHIMHIVTAVTFRNFVEKFAHNESIEQAVDHFTREMHLLKKGIFK